MTSRTLFLLQAIEETKKSIKNAVSFIVNVLENRRSISEDNLYELVIATYALTLLDAPLARTLLRQIERYSYTEGKKLKTTRIIIACVRSAFLDLPSSGTLKAKHLKSEDG